MQLPAVYTNFSAGVLDNETYAPVLLRTVHHRQGSNYITEHSGHDAFGNPHTIVQSSNLADDPAKITHLSYYTPVSLIDTAAHLTDARLWLVATLAAAYGLYDLSRLMA